MLRIDLDQLVEPPGDGLLPQMADCRRWRIAAHGLLKTPILRPAEKALQILGTRVFKSAASEAIAAASSNPPPTRPGR